MKFTIKKKTIAMIMLFATALGVVSVIVCASVISRYTDRQYRNSANELSATVAEVIDDEQFVRVRDKVDEIYRKTENKVGSWDWGSDEFNAYTALYDDIEKDEDFIQIRDYLRRIQNVNNVDCIYLVYLDAESKSFIYVIDGAEEDACPPGCIDPIYEINLGVLTDPERGFPAYITNTEEYGWLVSAGAPIYGKSGGVVGYAFTDISMNAIRKESADYTLRLVLFLMASTVILCVIGIIAVDRVLVKPIKTLSESAESYCKNEFSTLTAHDGFAKLNIKSNDEISALADSMKKMEEDINKSFSKILSMNAELNVSKSLANEMRELATKDSLTGVHSKASYDNEIKYIEERIANGEKEFGIAVVDLNYLKKTNDTYGHERGNVSLITVSNIICGVFAHSPVYRIGGDEFAVILRGNDYRKSEELEKEFNKKLNDLADNDGLEPWEKVSAAIGIAKFNAETDKDAKDVFERADELMYERKREMKSIRED